MGSRFRTDRFAPKRELDSSSLPFHPNYLGATFAADWDASVGVDPATDSSDLVTWTDARSGLVAFNGISGPGVQLKTNELDGRPVVRFVVDSLIGPAMSTLITVSAFTVFIVGRFTPPLDGDSAVSPYLNSGFARTTSGRFAMSMRSSTHDAQLMHDGGSSFDVAIGDSAGAENVYALFQARHGDNIINVRWADQPWGPDVASGSMNTLADLFEIGNPRFTGDIARVLCFKSKLNDVNNDLVRGYLQSEYPTGITV